MLLSAQRRAPTQAPPLRQLSGFSAPKELFSWRTQTETVAQEACAVILRFYRHGDLVQARLKKDTTPVTEADLAIDRLVQSALPKIAAYPVVSEESHAAGARVEAPSYWVVDPIDGTQNFINCDDEFSVAIALVLEGVPVIGIIAVPAKELIYSAQLLGGAEKLVENSRTAICHPGVRDPLCLLTSKLPSAGAAAKILEFCGRHGIEHETIERAGSAYKQGLLAEGVGDLVLCYDSMWEWDIAAGECLLREAGCYVVENPTLEPLRFNQLPDRKFRGYFAAHQDLVLSWTS